MAGWPFWAATTDDRIDCALDLAEVAPGERLIDLGCGDGRVLLRAAQRCHAVVSGVELDPHLASLARRLLAAHQVAGTVVEADFGCVALETDVIFAYLSPATLQRLSGRLATMPPGTRMVTIGYAVPGWAPAAVAGGGCYLYRFPPEVLEVDRTLVGWASDAMLVSVRAGAPALIAAKLHHPGGPIQVSVSGDLADVSAVRAGAGEAGAGTEIVVDLRLDPLPQATVLDGWVHLTAGPSLRVLVVVDPGEPGMWGLTASGARDVAAQLAAGRLVPVLMAARAR